MPHRGRHWTWLALLTLVAGCTAIANGHLSDKPAEGEGGSSGGTGGSAGAGGEGEGGTVAPPKKGNGTLCDSGAECASENCVDEVCCDQACIGGCLSCAEFGLYGTCIPLTGELGDCMDNELCDGEGKCTPVEGGGCSTGSECTSGFCADGVCCNEACDGNCESCLGADTGSVDGLCAPTDTDLEGECGATECIAKGQCCGEGAPPPGGTCPAVCNGGCAAGTCTIHCDEDGQPETCKSTNVVCPPGFDCVVQCQRHHACRDAIIDCPVDHECTNMCGGIDPEHGCEDADINCTNGPCNLVCAGDAHKGCKGTEIFCGSNGCDVECSNADQPSVTCDNACRCNTCP